MKQKDTQVRKMYKDILKRKKDKKIDLSRYGFDRTEPAEEPKEPKRNEPKIKITGDETGEVAYNLRQAEREKKTEATEEAKTSQELPQEPRNRPRESPEES